MISTPGPLRIALPALLAAACAGITGLARQESVPDAPQDGRPPNVLLVLVDEMPWDALGRAGNPDVRTPNLDRLAESGTLFSHAFSVAPICMPARRSLLTGRYAHVHGVVDNRSLPADGEILLTSILAHHGYDTALAGKLHFAPIGPDYGFDSFWSYQSEGPLELETYPAYLKRKHGRSRVHAVEPGSQPFPDDPLGRDIGRFPYPREDFVTHWITDRAIEFLQSRQDSPRPWFLQVGYRLPHTPYIAPEPYSSMYDPASLQVPQIPADVAAHRAGLSEVEQRHCVDDEGLLRALLAQFYGHVTNVDDNLGRLLAELEELGLDEDTLVVFTADHGNMLGERGLYLKGVMYERSVRVPLIVRAPGGADWATRVNRGAVQPGLVESVDLLPTLLEVAGLPVPAQGLQGRSFLGLMLGRREAWKERVFAERRTRMVRTPRWKLIETLEPGRYELYDLESDPREQRDLSGAPEHAERVAELAAELRAWRARRPAPPSIPGLPTPDYAVLDAGVREEYLARWKGAPEEDDD